MNEWLMDKVFQLRVQQVVLPSFGQNTSIYFEYVH